MASTIRQAVRTDPTIAQFERSLSASGASTSQVDGIVSSVETLAFAKQFYEADGNAAQNAIQSFTGKYEFLPNGGARIPSAVFNATTTNAATALQKITPDTIAVPPLFGQEGMPSQDEYLNLLKTNPTWITSPKEDGLWLMDGQGKVVRDKQGTPFAVPFSNTTAGSPTVDPRLGLTSRPLF